MMQRLLHKGPDAATAATAAPSTLARRLREGGWVWLDVTYDAPGEVAALAADFGFDTLTVEDVVDPSEFPKMDEYDGYLFLILFSLGAVDARIRTMELDVYLGPDYLVTLHEAPVPAIDWLWEEAQSTPALASGGADQLLARLVEASTRRVIPLMDHLEQELEVLEDRAILGDRTVVGDLQALRRDTIVLRRMTGPQRQVVNAMTREGLAHVGQRARLRFENVDDLLFRVTESLDASRALLASVLDTYRSTVAEDMNEVMKVLTVFSAILLPLSLLAGIYGMNFSNMPELRWEYGYFGVLAVMAVTAVGLWLYFANRGFIRGPSLRRVPRVVGRGLGGLVSLGTAPVRLVAHALLDEIPALRPADDEADHDGR